ncbi:16889_t:CDS:2, partial [Gigaspora rosea]
MASQFHILIEVMVVAKQDTTSRLLVQLRVEQAREEAVCLEDHPKKGFNKCHLEESQAGILKEILGRLTTIKEKSMAKQEGAGHAPKNLI